MDKRADPRLEKQFMRIQYLISYGIKQDADAMTQVLGEIFDNCVSVNDLYNVCRLLGEYGKKALHELHSVERAWDTTGEGFFGPLPSTNQDPAHLFAVRFITAAANEDKAAMLSLFETAYLADGNQTADSVGALAMQVSDLARRSIYGDKADKKP